MRDAEFRLENGNGSISCPPDGCMIQHAKVEMRHRTEKGTDVPAIGTQRWKTILLVQGMNPIFLDMTFEEAVDEKNRARHEDESPHRDRSKG